MDFYFLKSLNKGLITIKVVLNFITLTILGICTRIKPENEQYSLL